MSQSVEKDATFVKHYLVCDHHCACGDQKPHGMDEIKWMREHQAALVPEGVCPICGGVIHDERCRWEGKAR
jgi:hypothetical protein